MNRTQKITLFAAFTLMTLSVHAESFTFLSYGEFQSLTSSEKKFYVQAVQKVSIDFEEHMSSLSAQGAKWSALFKNFSGSEAQASDLQADNVHERSLNDVRMENAKISYVIARAKMLARVSSQHAGPATKQYATELFNDAYERVNILAKKSMSTEEKINFLQNLNALRSAQQEVGKQDSSVNSKANSIDQLIATTGHGRSSVESAPPRPFAAAATEIITEKYDRTPADNPNPAAPRCIYAGFVVKKTKCEAVTLLPEDFYLAEINNNTFKCDPADGDILCNPLVFGFKNTDTAYCTKRSVSASSECSRTSDNIDNARRLIALWNNPKNKDALEQYQNDLNQICELAKSKNNDVSKTCKVVQAQFNAKLQAQLIVDSRAKIQKYKGSIPPIEAKPKTSSPTKSTN